MTEKNTFKGACIIFLVMFMFCVSAEGPENSLCTLPGGGGTPGLTPSPPPQQQNHHDTPKSQPFSRSSSDQASVNGVSFNGASSNGGSSTSPFPQSHRLSDSVDWLEKDNRPHTAPLPPPSNEAVEKVVKNALLRADSADTSDALFGRPECVHTNPMS